MFVAVVVLIVIGILAVIGLLAWLSYQFAKKRRRALAAFAGRHGLRYEQKDSFGLVDEPFRLFSIGWGRRCENVLHGDWGGLPIKEADYTYHTESTDFDGSTSTTHYYFSVVLATLPAVLPGVSIERENLFTRLADHLGFADVQFESEEFNQEFNVKAEDRGFALALIDAGMAEWLLRAGGDFSFECRGPTLLTYSRLRDADALVPLLDAAKGFHDHVPGRVWSEHRKGGAATDSPGPRTAGPARPEGGSLC